MTKSKMTYILEIIWAVVTVLTLVIALHSTFSNGFDKSIVFYILSFVSFLMFFIRRHRRLKSQK